MTTVLVTATYSEESLNALRSRLPNTRFVQIPQSGAVPEDAKNAEVLLRCFMSKPQLQTALALAANLTWIHTCTAGFDQLLVPEIEQRGLLVTRSAATTHIPIAEWVVTCIAFMAKDFGLLFDAQRKRQWVEPAPIELFDSTIGIIGAGAIGTEVARRARGFGMKVIGSQRTPRPNPLFDTLVSSNDLDPILRESDFVVVACPLTTETEGLIATPEFRKMKRTAFLVNIARGAIVVESDLIAALEDGLIAGAALDVFTQEPLPADSPLWAAPGLLVTPHSSFRSPNSTIRGVDEFVSNMVLFEAGQDLNNPLRDIQLGY